jgi:hypothetical protein
MFVRMLPADVEKPSANPNYRIFEAQSNSGAASPATFSPYSLSKVVHCCEESPKGLLPAAIVNNFARIDIWL